MPQTTLEKGLLGILILGNIHCLKGCGGGKCATFELTGGGPGGDSLVNLGPKMWGLTAREKIS